MKQFLRQNKIFLSLYLVFLVAGAVILLVFEKGNEILYFNSLHTPFGDRFFSVVTQLAELPVFALILLVTIRFSYGKGLVLGLNSLLVFIVIVLCKFVFFADQIRPSVFFEGKAQLHFVANMEILREHTFPSGHTAIAFAICFMLSLLAENKRWAVLLFTIPLLVGISRVYLMEHFFRDVYFGSLTGVIISAAFYLTFVRSRFYQNLAWREKTLLRW